jgi:hypothetical protein
LAALGHRVVKANQNDYTRITLARTGARISLAVSSGRRIMSEFVALFRMNHHVIVALFMLLRSSCAYNPKAASGCVDLSGERTASADWAIQ